MSTIEKALPKNDVIALLARSPHGKLAEYLPIATAAAKDDPEFFAKLISYNHIKGEIRDAKVALPAIGLRVLQAPEYRENALAHLATLDPRNLRRAIVFNKEIGAGNFRDYARLVSRYLHTLERKWGLWERRAVQHRETMKALYQQFHVKPNREMVGWILFDGRYPTGSVFDIIRNLSSMSPTEAAGHILEKKIPFLIAAGALGEKAKEPDLVMALMDRMSATELVTNQKWLKKLGVKENPALRAAYEKAMAAAGGSSKNMLKTQVAAEAVDPEDQAMAEKLKALQERQIETAKAKGQGVEGDWLVLADKSASMEKAIEASRHVAAVLAKMVTGKVHLVFFDLYPRYFDATGKTYDALVKETRTVEAQGGTSIGCGLLAMLERKVDIDGIAIVSDGSENIGGPAMFANVYKDYARKFDKKPPVYLYRCFDGMPSHRNIDLAVSMANAGIELQEFDIRQSTDYYGIPTLAQTMRVDRYGLVQQIMDMRLLTLDDVLGPERKAA